jgi:hypothetical protein
MSVEMVRAVVAELARSTAALAAVGAALESRANETPLAPPIRARLDAVLDSLGVRDAVDGLGPAEIGPILASVRVDLLSGAKLASRAEAPGWAHVEPALLEAAGDVSAGFPSLLKARIAPRLDGLAERLEARGAAFLDIGTGVAALSIAMARRWPRLKIVGIEPWGPSIAIARARVAASGLAGRIMLREQAGEDLPDVAAFDLAWIPSAFIPEAVLPRIVERAARALKPGGWLLLAMLNAAGDSLAASLVRLRATLWGGLLAPPATVEALLAQAGLGAVATLPGPPSSPIVMVAGRR